MKDRWFVSLFVLFPFLASGCIAPLDPANDETRGDTFPDPGTTPTTAATTSADSPQPSPDPTDDNDARVTKEDTDPSAPGLRLVAHLMEGQDSHQVEATATNEGPDTYRVDVACAGPWRSELRDPEGTSFSDRERLSGCQAMELEAFGPDGSRDITLWWNETRWRQGEGTEQVPPGTYTWEVSFEAWTEDGATRATLTTEFVVRVD